jgi:mannosyltransferase
LTFHAARARWPQALVVAGPVAVGLLLAVWNLGAKPFWYDETFEGLLVQRRPLDFARWIVTFETTGALYHAFLWLWKFIGTSEGVLRLPSAIFAVASLPVTFLVARRVLPLPFAALATLLLATAGYWVHYAQEARPYALYLLLAGLSTLALLRAVEDPTRRRWLAYAAVSVLAVWTHLFMVFVVAAHAAAVMLHPDRRRWWRRAALAVLAAFAAGVPIVISLYFNLHRFGWMAGATPLRVGRAVEELTGDVGPLVALAWLAVWVGGAVVGVVRWRAAPVAAWPALLIVLLAVVPIALPTLLSLVRPMLVTRYLIPVLPALAILAALLLATTRWRLAALAALAVLLMLNGAAVLRWYTLVDRPDWRSATAFVLERAGPDTRAIYFTRGPLDGGARYEYLYYVSQHPGRDSPAQLTLAPGPGSIAERTSTAIAGTQRLLAVAYSWSAPSTVEALSAIEAEFALTEQAEYQQIGVRLYERRPDGRRPDD